MLENIFFKRNIYINGTTFIAPDLQWTFNVYSVIIKHNSFVRPKHIKRMDNLCHIHDLEQTFSRVENGELRIKTMVCQNIGSDAILSIYP